MSDIREFHILNLGAGVQSTDLYLLSMFGEIQRFDFAICSDTQDEIGSEERRNGLPDPEESFYAHLEWMGTQAAYLDSKSPLVKSSSIGGPGCPILVRTRGWISDDLLRDDGISPNHPKGVNYDAHIRHRFASIPAFISVREGHAESMVPRQCTKEYKIEVIERCIRYEILGLNPGDRIPKDVIVHQYIGISWDERSRAFDIARRFKTDESERTFQQVFSFGNDPSPDDIVESHIRFKERPNWRVHFPLIENGRTDTREICSERLRARVPHKVYGSSCMMCPFKDDPTWRRHLEPGPTRERLIEIDTGIRTPGVIAGRNLEQSLYLHRSCRPIDKIDFSEKPSLGFGAECEGGCGL